MHKVQLISMCVIRASVSYSSFCVLFERLITLISLEVTIVKVDKGLLNDIVTFYDHSMSCMFW